MKLKLIMLFIIISSKSFPANFEFAFGGGVEDSAEFSYAYDPATNVWLSESGSRIDNGLSANAFIDIGANFELPNTNIVLNSVSLLFETGYHYYMRVRTRYEDYPEYKHRFFYHNLILGVITKLNFNNDISFGIGAGIYLPLYSESSKRRYEVNIGLASYSYNGYKKFDFKKISYMYKVPIMPYIKLNLERNLYMSKRWTFKFGANLIYNFGMEFDMDKLKSGSYGYGYDKYKFSSLSGEVFLGFGFGRPK